MTGSLAVRRADSSAGLDLRRAPLASVQGIDFRAPLKTSLRLQDAHALVRSKVAFYAHDRYFAPDITAIQSLVESGEFHRFVPGLRLSR